KGQSAAPGPAAPGTGLSGWLLGHDLRAAAGRADSGAVCKHSYEHYGRSAAPERAGAVGRAIGTAPGISGCRTLGDLQLSAPQQRAADPGARSAGRPLERW